ncbi:MAG: hypothetical protein C0618_01110 [Desulfuromonas sp.]|nr:MAG: hypothetical protein C0618_01110 [Desulfuromonas sp.]
MNVLICIKNRIIVEGIKTLIATKIPDAILGEHCFESPVHEPDLVLFISRDDIIDLKRIYAKAKFIYFDQGLSDSELACLLYCHGVCGVISPTLDTDKFCKALKKVYTGEIWLDQKHLHLLLQQGQTLSDRKNLHKLSDQDRRIVQMVANGETNKEIAGRLFLSLPTVKAHLSRIFKRLNVENRSQLASLATKGLDLSAE